MKGHKDKQRHGAKFNHQIKWKPFNKSLSDSYSQVLTYWLTDRVPVLCLEEDIQPPDARGERDLVLHGRQKIELGLWRLFSTLIDSLNKISPPSTEYLIKMFAICNRRKELSCITSDKKNQILQPGQNVRFG